MDKTEIIGMAKKEEVKSVTFMFSDIYGTIKKVIIPYERLRDSLENGAWSSGKSVDGFVRTYDGKMYLFFCS